MKQITEEVVSSSKLEEVRKKAIVDAIKAEVSRIRNYTPKVAIFGDTGVGKSSLCNALFGKKIAEISDVEACTREPQEIFLSEGNSGITLIDVPGVGEDPQRHHEYKKLYKSLLPSLDLIVWAIKADDRKYASAIEVYQEILEPNLAECPVIFVVTQVDKIEPARNWNLKESKPGDEQIANLAKKINDVSDKFNVSTNKIVPVSSNDSWNLVELVNKIVEILPNEKKYAFTREAKEENVSEEARKGAEKGIWDSVKEIAGDAWDTVKDVAVNAIVQTAPKIISSVSRWIKSWF